MDPNSLKAFIAVVDQGSFSEAAETLHLTQPAVSKRLATLEHQLGVSLIDRGQRQLQITEAGSRLLPHARRILDEVHNARLSMRDDPGAVQGHLGLIASHHIGLHHLPTWLRRFNREHAAVTLGLQFMDSESAYDQMSKRLAELAFVTLDDRMDRRFEVHVRWQDPMAFVVGPGHPLADLANPTLADLAHFNALLPEAGTSTTRAVSRLFLEASLSLSPQMPTNYLETIKVMTSVGLGWSVLPHSMIDETLKVLPLTEAVSRMLGAIGLRGRLLTPAARAMLAIVDELR